MRNSVVKKSNRMLFEYSSFIDLNFILVISKKFRFARVRTGRVMRLELCPLSLERAWARPSPSRLFLHGSKFGFEIKHQARADIDFTPEFSSNFPI